MYNSSSSSFTCNDKLNVITRMSHKLSKNNLISPTNKINNNCYSYNRKLHIYKSIILKYKQIRKFYQGLYNNKTKNLKKAKIKLKYRNYAYHIFRNKIKNVLKSNKINHKISSLNNNKNKTSTNLPNNIRDLLNMKYTKSIKNDRDINLYEKQTIYQDNFLKNFALNTNYNNENFDFNKQSIVFLFKNFHSDSISPHSLFSIECVHKGFPISGSIYWTDRFRIRHMISDNYVIVKSKQSEDKSNLNRFLSNNNHDPKNYTIISDFNIKDNFEESLFMFDKCTPDKFERDIIQIKYNDCFYIRHIKTGLFLCLKIQMINDTNFKINKKDNSSEHKHFINNISKNSNNITNSNDNTINIKSNSSLSKVTVKDNFENNKKLISCLSLTNKINDQNMFSIQKASIDYIWETNYIKHCCIHLKYYLSIKNELEKSDIFDIYLHTIKCIILLDNFCNNRLLIKLKEFSEYNEPCKERQGILRVSGILDIINNILLKLNMLLESEDPCNINVNTYNNNYFNIDLFTLKNLRLYLVDKTFSLISSFCCNNEVNKKLCFNNIDNYSKLIEKSKVCLKTLKDILNGNRNLLLKISNDKAVNANIKSQKRKINKIYDKSINNNSFITNNSSNLTEDYTLNINNNKSNNKLNVSKISDNNCIKLKETEDSQFCTEETLSSLSEDSNISELLNCSNIKDKNNFPLIKLIIDKYLNNAQISNDCQFENKIIELIRIMINCKGKGINQNQLEVLSLFLNQNDNNSEHRSTNFLNKFNFYVNKENDILCCIKSDKIRTYNINKIKFSEDVSYDIFNRLSLICDVCIGNNYLAKSYITKKLNKLAIEKTINNDNTTDEIKIILCKLYIVLYFEKYSIPFKIPYLCKVITSTMDDEYFSLLDTSNYNDKKLNYSFSYNTSNKYTNSISNYYDTENINYTSNNCFYKRNNNTSLNISINDNNISNNNCLKNIGLKQIHKYSDNKLENNKLSQSLLNLSIDNTLDKNDTNSTFKYNYNNNVLSKSSIKRLKFNNLDKNKQIIYKSDNSSINFTKEISLNESNIFLTENKDLESDLKNINSKKQSNYEFNKTNTINKNNEHNSNKKNNINNISLIKTYQCPYNLKLLKLILNKLLNYIDNKTNTLCNQSLNKFKENMLLESLNIIKILIEFNVLEYLSYNIYNYTVNKIIYILFNLIVIIKIKSFCLDNLNSIEQIKKSIYIDGRNNIINKIDLLINNSKNLDVNKNKYNNLRNCDISSCSNLNFNYNCLNKLKNQTIIKCKNIKNIFNTNNYKSKALEDNIIIISIKILKIVLSMSNTEYINRFIKEFFNECKDLINNKIYCENLDPKMLTKFYSKLFLKFKKNFPNYDSKSGNYINLLNYRYLNGYLSNLESNNKHNKLLKRSNINLNLENVILNLINMSTEKNIQAKLYSILYDIYNQRHSYLINIRNLVLIHNRVNISIYNRIHSIVIDLKNIFEQTEVWLNLSKQKQLIFNCKKIRCLLKELLLLSDSNKNIVYVKYPERTQNFILSIFKNMDIIKLFYEFLYEIKYFLKVNYKYLINEYKEYCSLNYETTSNQLLSNRKIKHNNNFIITKMLVSIYDFLTSLCKDKYFIDLYLEELEILTYPLVIKSVCHIPIYEFLDELSKNSIFNRLDKLYYIIKSLRFSSNFNLENLPLVLKILKNLVVNNCEIKLKEKVIKILIFIKVIICYSDNDCYREYLNNYKNNCTIPCTNKYQPNSWMTKAFNKIKNSDNSLKNPSNYNFNNKNEDSLIIKKVTSNKYLLDIKEKKLNSIKNFKSINLNNNNMNNKHCINVNDNIKTHHFESINLIIKIIVIIKQSIIIEFSRIERIIGLDFACNLLWENCCYNIECFKTLSLLEKKYVYDKIKMCNSLIIYINEFHINDNRLQERKFVLGFLKMIKNIQELVIPTLANLNLHDDKIKEDLYFQCFVYFFEGIVLFINNIYPKFLSKNIDVKQDRLFSLHNELKIKIISNFIENKNLFRSLILKNSNIGNIIDMSYLKKFISDNNYSINSDVLNELKMSNEFNHNLEYSNLLFNKKEDNVFNNNIKHNYELILNNDKNILKYSYLNLELLWDYFVAFLDKTIVDINNIENKSSLLINEILNINKRKSTIYDQKDKYKITDIKFKDNYLHDNERLNHDIINNNKLDSYFFNNIFVMLNPENILIQNNAILSLDNNYSNKNINNKLNISSNYTKDLFKFYNTKFKANSYFIFEFILDDFSNLVYDVKEEEYELTYRLLNYYDFKKDVTGLHSINIFKECNTNNYSKIDANLRYFDKILLSLVNYLHFLFYSDFKIDINIVKFLSKSIISLFYFENYDVSNSICKDKAMSIYNNQMQNKILNLSIHSIIIDIIWCGRDDLNIYFSYFLKILNNLMHNYNKNVQDSIYEVFVNKSNIEPFYDLISKSIKKDMFLLSVLKNTNLNSELIDEENNSLIENILIFLSRLCLNQNSNWQIFMSTNIQDNNNIDIVSFIQLYLSKLINKISNKNLSKINLCLEFLNNVYENNCNIEYLIRGIINTNILDDIIKVLNLCSKFDLVYFDNEVVNNDTLLFLSSLNLLDNNNIYNISYNKVFNLPKDKIKTCSLILILIKNILFLSESFVLSLKYKFNDKLISDLIKRYYFDIIRFNSYKEFILLKQEWFESNEIWYEKDSNIKIFSFLKNKKLKILTNINKNNKENQELIFCDSKEVLKICFDLCIINKKLKSSFEINAANNLSNTSINTLKDNLLITDVNYKPENLNNCYDSYDFYFYNAILNKLYEIKKVNLLNYNSYNCIQNLLYLVKEICYYYYNVILNIKFRKNKINIIRNNKLYYFKFEFNQYIKNNSKTKIDHIFNKFDNFLANIEVFYNNNYSTLYFPILPVCLYIDESLRNTFVNDVSRESIESKLVYLVKKSKEYKIVVTSSFNFYSFLKNTKLIYIIFKYVKLWKDLSFIISLALNLLIIMSFTNFPVYNGHVLKRQTVNETRQKAIMIKYPSIFGIDNWYAFLNTYYAFMFLGIMQIFNFSIICIHQIFVILSPKFKIIKAKKLFNYLKSKKESQKLTKNNKYSILFINTLFNYSIFKESSSRKFSVCISSLIEVLNNYETLYYFVSLIMSFAGIYHPFYFVALMLCMSIRYPAFKTLIKSFYVSRGLILVSITFYFILTYYFVIIVFYYFYNQLKKPELCNNFYNCFFHIVNIGPKIDDWWMIDIIEPYKIKTFRFWFDTMYIILVVMIWLVVFPSLIIDTFKYMSFISKIKEDDVKNICYICGYNRKEIEKIENYNNHISTKHNYWNYVYYIIFLINKPDRNLIEQYIYNQISNNKINWIPSILNNYLPD